MSTRTIDASDRVKMVAFFNEGKCVLEVLKKFPQYSKAQVCATKAHLTIGSYDVHSPGKVAEPHKDAIVNLFKTGLNSKAILQKTKYKYTPQQVAGIIAAHQLGRI